MLVQGMLVLPPFQNEVRECDSVNVQVRASYELSTIQVVVPRLIDKSGPPLFLLFHILQEAMLRYLRCLSVNMSGCLYEEIRCKDNNMIGSKLQHTP